MKKILNTIRTGLWFKLEKNKKTYLPLAITNLLRKTEGDYIELYLGPNNEVILKKYGGKI